MERSEEEKTQQQNNPDGLKPDTETLNTTDPQKHMEGPISSLIKKAGEGFDKNQTKEEADEEKEKAM